MTLGNIIICQVHWMCLKNYTRKQRMRELEKLAEKLDNLEIPAQDRNEIDVMIGRIERSVYMLELEVEAVKEQRDYYEYLSSKPID